MSGVEREEVEALPLVPKGNLVSKAPERELEEVLGREDEAIPFEVGAPREPQVLTGMPWEAE
jgi:hypothetical protein